MRETQFVGLTTKAEMFIKDNARTATISTPCPTCHRDHWKREEFELTLLGKVTGMVEEEVHTLRQFVHVGTGRKFEEFVQAEPWSSGPMIFLGLRWSDTQEPISGLCWESDPTVEDSEYDYVSGKYYV